MSSSDAIVLDDLGKRYLLGEREPYLALRDVVSRTARRALSRAEPAPPADKHIWALRHASLRIRQGEAVGLIGPNGAGKSTLLKLLSRITEPTEGRAELRGRLGSLLEVGTGFHTELTGRENIFLNGSILGMKRAEIRRRFDDIVMFSEVEKFLDTPVKHFSSGMYVRLAFAVAAHLDLDILLVDEVLAVGDASFQRKCLGKMEEVASTGRTVVFVSHNMTAINQLCDRALLLTGGRIADDGPTEKVVSGYLQSTASGSAEARWDDPAKAPGGSIARLAAVRVVANRAVTEQVPIDADTSIEVDFRILERGARTLAPDIYLLDSFGNTVLSTAPIPGANTRQDEWFGQVHEPGMYRSVCVIPANFLNDIRYYVTVHLVAIDTIAVEATAEQAVSFDVFDTGVMREGGGQGAWHGMVRPRLAWHVERVASPLARTE
jgi:lipopolysaccharide transport system ATP-binding protein